jgi:hypothetical protein
MLGDHERGHHRLWEIFKTSIFNEYEHMNVSILQQLTLKKPLMSKNKPPCNLGNIDIT